MLRREGLYSSHLVEWRRARDAGALKELAPKARPAKRTPEQVEIDRARQRNERLEDELAKHKLALEIQGKASELLERLLAESNEDEQAAAVIDECFDAIEPMLGTRSGVHGGGPAAGDALPPAGTTATAFDDAAAGAAEQADRRGGGRDPGRVALGAVR